MIAFETNKPYGYGRVFLKNNNVQEIIEEINLETSQKNINLCNSGILLVNKKILFNNLKYIKENKLKKEKYLPDICKILSNKDIPTSYIKCKENNMIGINTISDFVKAQNILQKKYINKFINKGVIFLKSESCYLSYDTKIEPNVVIEGNVTIKNNITIKKGCVIKNNSYLEGAVINDNCIVGPSARIRPKSFIGKNSKIGNFVEIKNSKIGNNVAISHLSYVETHTLEIMLILAQELLLVIMTVRKNTKQ